MAITSRDIERAAEELPPIAAAINIREGQVTNRAVAKTFDMPYKSLERNTYHWRETRNVDTANRVVKQSLIGQRHFVS